MKKITVACLLVAALVAPANAHHSFAMFDADKTVTLKGTLYAVEWKMPHCWFWIAVTGKGEAKPVLWGLEGGNPGTFAYQGATKADFKIGEAVTVDIHPLKNGQNGGQFLRMTFPNGKVVGSLKTPIDAAREKGYVK